MRRRSGRNETDLGQRYEKNIAQGYMAEDGSGLTRVENDR